MPYNDHRPRIGRDVFFAPAAVVIGEVDLHGGVGIRNGAVLHGGMEPITEP